MEQTNFIKVLKNIDTSAYNAIIEVLKSNGITKLDMSNEDDVHAYCYDVDRKRADKTKLDWLILVDNQLEFVDEFGTTHHVSDFPNGTIPYIYNVVLDIVKNMLINM